MVIVLSLPITAAAFLFERVSKRGKSIRVDIEEIGNWVDDKPTWNEKYDPGRKRLATFRDWLNAIERIDESIEDYDFGIRLVANGNECNYSKVQSCECGSYFAVVDESGSRRYCSDECRYLHHNPKVVHSDRPCDQCGTPYTPLRTTSKFCSTKCRVYASR